MDNKIKLNAFEYSAYWWVSKIRGVIDDVVEKGEGTNDRVDLAELMWNLTDKHWRMIYLHLTRCIEQEYKVGGNFFTQETRASYNDHYPGHNKINEMINSMFNGRVKIPNANLNKEDEAEEVYSIHNANGTPIVYISDYELVRKVDTVVERNYIVTGDASLLNDMVKE